MTATYADIEGHGYIDDFLHVLTLRRIKDEIFHGNWKGDSPSVILEMINRTTDYFALRFPLCVALRADDDGLWHQFQARHRGR